VCSSVKLFGHESTRVRISKDRSARFAYLIGPALLGAGITRLEQVTQLSELALGKLHGMGPKALGLLREALTARNLKFKSD
jgi:hypothetical protein